MISETVLEIALTVACPLPYRVGKPKAAILHAPMTLVLLVVNIAIFLGGQLFDRSPAQQDAIFFKFGLIPAQFHLISLFTYGFFHVGYEHIIWNLLFLYLIGPSIEKKVGSPLFVLLYFAGGAVAGLIHTALTLHFGPASSDARNPLVGASASISAIIGLFATFGARRKLQFIWLPGRLISREWMLFDVSAGIGVLLWLIQTLYGAATTAFQNQGGIAYFAHIGGFLFGLLCGWAGGLRNSREAEDNDLNDAAQKPIAAPQAIRQSASPDIVSLLERCIAEEDYPRAWSMYGKCRAVGAIVPKSVIERLRELATVNGHPEQAASLVSDGIKSDKV